MVDQQVAQYDDWMHIRYDPWYPQLHSENHGPFRPMLQLIGRHLPAERIADPASLTVLDAACGTGNNYIAFSRGGFTCGFRRSRPAIPE